MGLKTLIAGVMTFLTLASASYGIGVYVRPSQTGDTFIGDTLNGCLIHTDTLSYPVGVTGLFAINDLNFSPMPGDDDSVAYIWGTNSAGASINIKNPNYTCGGSGGFPDVAPTDAGGEHNIMIDSHMRDSTGVDPYLGDFYYTVKRLDNPSDSITQHITFEPGYPCHISNLSFTNPPRHGDSLIAIVTKEYSGQKWRDSLMVEMDTTEYWSAFVVPRITLNPEDSVATGIKEFEDKVKDYELQTYPNPFNAAVTISIGVGSGTTYHRPQTIYQIEILDINGRMVADISVGDVRERPDDGRFTNRPYEITWTPEESITSSVYLIRATAGDKSVTKRIVYLR